MNNVANPVIYLDKMIIVTRIVSLLLDYLYKMIIVTKIVSLLLDYQDKMIIVTKIVLLLLDYQDKMVQLVERLFSHRCDVPVQKVGESDKNQRI